MQRDELADMAAFFGLTLLTAAVLWMDVTRLYCAPGWRRCPVALADVDLAGALSVPVSDLTQ